MSWWSDDTIQGLWWTAALAAATNEQFAYVWPQASERHSINHTSTVAAVGVSVPGSVLGFFSVFSHAISPFPACLLLVCLSLFSIHPCAFFSPLPNTFSLLGISQHLSFHIIAQTGFSKTAKCFYMKASFASHSWCGGGPACFHKRIGRNWCLRVTTVRSSSTLVPLGGTCMVGRFSLTAVCPNKKVWYLERKKCSLCTIRILYSKHLHSALSYILACGWTTSKVLCETWHASLDDVIWGYGEKV